MKGKKIEIDHVFAISQLIWFAGEKKPYKVRACNSEFVILTKPYNVRKTVIYTIIDIKNKIKGTENLIFCMGFETDKDCLEALLRLTKGESEITHRNFTGIIIDRIKYIPAGIKKPIDLDFTQPSDYVLINFQNANLNYRCKK